jgi:hypothetical protein
LPLDYAFGFELGDTRGCNRGASASAEALTVAGFLDRGRGTGLAMGTMVSDISVTPDLLPGFPSI